ncbi:hypothetical protein [Paraconexibacter sp.]|uniref:hypothetical protein n=1 Tax=Paraconexibacter sp. TaxID=2949640 RepID=UPI0035658BDD
MTTNPHPRTRALVVLAWGCAVVVATAGVGDADRGLRALIDDGPLGPLVPGQGGQVVRPPVEAASPSTRSAAPGGDALPPSTDGGSRRATTNTAASTKAAVTLIAAAGPRRRHVPGTSGDAEPVGGAGAAGTLSLDDGTPGALPRIETSGVRPGTSETMRVRVVNSGAAPARLVAGPAGLTDRPGSLGGRLSQRLILRITDVDGTVRTASPLAAAGPTALPVVPARASRTWLVTLAFPDGGPPPSPTSGDNVYQGADVTFRLALTEIR